MAMQDGQASGAIGSHLLVCADVAAAQAGQAVLCQVLVGLRSVGLLAVLRLVRIPSEPANILL